MLSRPSAATLRQIVGVVYISPYASPEALKRVRRFVRGHAKGNHRWGYLFKYPMIEFDDIDDLSAMRKKFARLVEGYKDLSDCPEQPD